MDLRTKEETFRLVSAVDKLISKFQFAIAKHTGIKLLIVEIPAGMHLCYLRNFSP